MTAVQISKHSLFRLKITVGSRLCAYPSNHFSLDEEDTLKITVGCRLCAYPSILLFLTKTLSRSRSVVDRAHFQAFTFRLKITVGCRLCTCPSIRVCVCVVRVGLCLWCVVWRGLARGKTSVCRFKTSPCAGSKLFRVNRQNARMFNMRAFLPVHTEAF